MECVIHLCLTMECDIDYSVDHVVVCALYLAVLYLLPTLYVCGSMYDVCGSMHDVCRSFAYHAC